MNLPETGWSLKNRPNTEDVSIFQGCNYGTEFQTIYYKSAERKLDLKGLTQNDKEWFQQLDLDLQDKTIIDL